MLGLSFSCSSSGQRRRNEAGATQSNQTQNYYYIIIEAVLRVRFERTNMGYQDSPKIAATWISRHLFSSPDNQAHLLLYIIKNTNKPTDLYRFIPLRVHQSGSLFPSNSTRTPHSPPHIRFRYPQGYSIPVLFRDMQPSLRPCCGMLFTCLTSSDPLIISSA